ncbi:MAG: ABC transporter ATP-binding protein [Verrucomicrobiae bacterium]|nr:ABC transporter ATP-binding protein [Verrucomicrobiae bacterium]
MLVLENICRRFGALEVLRGVDLSIPSGEYFCLAGPSGCGKTTLLRLVAGLLEPDLGTILIAGERVRGIPPQGRPVAMTFQTPALWPHRTVHGNVAFGLEARGVSIREREMRVAAALRQVRLEEVADALPQMLSGGQQQRVALARALAVAPRLLLLDEPLSQLDPALRAELRQELRRLHGELGITVVHVTHDPREAMALGDRIGLLLEGRLAQVADPRTLHRHPISRAVAGFFGEVNWLEATVIAVGPEHWLLATAAGEFRRPSAGDPPYGSRGWLGIRPGSFRPVAETAAELRVRVERAEFLGETVVLTARGPGEVSFQIQFPSSDPIPRAGEILRVGVPPAALLWVPETSGG